MLYNCPVFVLIAFNSQPIIVPMIVVTTVIVIYLNIELIPLKRQLFSMLTSLAALAVPLVVARSFTGWDTEY